MTFPGAVLCLNFSCPEKDKASKVSHSLLCGPIETAVILLLSAGQAGMRLPPRGTGSKLGKEYVKAVLSVLLFNLYAEYNMGNAGLDESQAGIKIAGRNIKNLGYADDTTPGRCGS